ncbi:MAG: bacillithiol biosynthesis protein BshC, partial [Gemmatimonadaceae bacterium]
MSTEPVVLTEALGGSALSRAARAGQLEQWYPRPPRGAEWREHAARVRASVPAGWYADLAPAIAARGAAAERLRRAADTGIVVTTGQQAGLFGGPLMTLTKALTARALADVLQETTGLPVAPLFWAATDDADFDEAAVVSVSLDAGARELRLEHRAPAGTPMARVPLDQGELDALTPFLREACGSAPHASYLGRVLDAYRGGATVGDAYVTLLRGLLESLEVGVLDASHPALVNAAAPAIRRAMASSDAIAHAVRRRDADIVAAGFSPQVEAVEGLSLVSLNAGGIKRRLPVREAASFVSSATDVLSATVLLRPVIERAILPAAVYLGGPGEIAYFAQVSAVAGVIDVPAPIVLPRWSGTILEPRVQRILNELGVGPDALGDPHALEGRVARARLPVETAAAISALKRDLESNLDTVRRSAAGLVPDAVIDGLHRSFEHRLERLDRRVIAATKRREADVMRSIATARGSLFPHGARQERKLAYAAFLARYGPSLLEQML